MTAGKYVPSRDDHYSFGTWAVGRQGTDVLGFAALAAAREDDLYGACR